jgi:hypothetical protein
MSKLAFVQLYRGYVSWMPYLNLLFTFFGSRDGSVGIATGWTARVRLPAGHDFYLPHSVQTGSGAHPASYPVGTGGDFPGG